jgi:hypothetical protein
MGVAYASRIVSNALAALRGVLLTGNISDENRRNIEVVVVVLAAVGDFLAKLSEVLGAPALPLNDSGIRADVVDAAETLRRITDGL